VLVGAQMLTGVCDKNMAHLLRLGKVGFKRESVGFKTLTIYTPSFNFPVFTFRRVCQKHKHKKGVIAQEHVASLQQSSHSTHRHV
jgi:hypothetical protein